MIFSINKALVILVYISIIEGINLSFLHGYTTLLRGQMNYFQLSTGVSILAMLLQTAFLSYTGI